MIVTSNIETKLTPKAIPIIKPIKPKANTINLGLFFEILSFLSYLYSNYLIIIKIFNYNIITITIYKYIKINNY